VRLSPSFPAQYYNEVNKMGHYLTSHKYLLVTMKACSRKPRGTVITNPHTAEIIGDVVINIEPHLGSLQTIVTRVEIEQPK
jgi:hypothetical protein